MKKKEKKIGTMILPSLYQLGSMYRYPYSSSQLYYLLTTTNARQMDIMELGKAVPNVLQSFLKTVYQNRPKEVKYFMLYQQLNHNVYTTSSQEYLFWAFGFLYVGIVTEFPFIETSSCYILTHTDFYTYISWKKQRHALEWQRYHLYRTYQKSCH